MNPTVSNTGPCENQQSENTIQEPSSSQDHAASVQLLDNDWLLSQLSKPPKGLLRLLPSERLRNRASVHKEIV